MMPRQNALGLASWLLLTLWLAGSVAAFWFMQIGNSRSFGPTATAFDGVDAAQVERWFRSTSAATASHAGAPFKLTLVHLYDADCRCNRFVEPDLKRLVAHYQSLGVHFLAAPAHGQAAKLAVPSDLTVIDENRELLAAAGVNSSPAALIFDGNGRLIYYGPYSDSAWCGSTGTLVEPVLERALFGLPSVRRPRASRGCFCGW